MARQVVYEGQDLQQLLQQVLDEHGPARIHPPERRRKGGVLGFFAREVYVITVDVDAPTGTSAASAGRSSGASAGTSAGASAAPHANGLDADGPAETNGVAARSLTTARSETGSRLVASGDPSLGYGVGGGARGPMPGAPVRSPLTALVEATEDEAELGSAPYANGAERPVQEDLAVGGEEGGTGGVAPRDAAGDGGMESRDAGGDAARAAAPRHAAPRDGEVPFGEVLSEVASSLGEEPGTYRPDPDRLRRTRRPRPVGRSSDSSESELPADERARDVVPAPAVEAAEPAPGGETAEPAPAVEAAEPAPGGETAVQLPLIEIEDETPPDLAATIVDLLRAAGFPEHLMPRAPLTADRSTIEAVFASLPEPPPLPTEPGGLVAVVGSAGLVRPVANAVALAVGCPRDEVAVASASASDRHARPEYRARTAGQAASMSPGWRRDRVGVVAVYAPPLGADQRWTRQMLRALRPSCVWAMAGATVKPDDVRRWVAAIGGADALALTEVGATATPASILSLGIPVARLDDDSATPARWAEVVADLVTKH